MIHVCFYIRRFYVCFYIRRFYFMVIELRFFTKMNMDQICLDLCGLVCDSTQLAELPRPSVAQLVEHQCRVSQVESCEAAHFFLVLGELALWSLMVWVFHVHVWLDKVPQPEDQMSLKHYKYTFWFLGTTRPFLYLSTLYSIYCKHLCIVSASLDTLKELSLMYIYMCVPLPSLLSSLLSWLAYLLPWLNEKPRWYIDV